MQIFLIFLFIVAGTAASSVTKIEQRRINGNRRPSRGPCKNCKKEDKAVFFECNFQKGVAILHKDDADQEEVQFNLPDNQTDRILENFRTEISQEIQNSLSERKGNIKGTGNIQSLVRPMRKISQTMALIQNDISTLSNYSGNINKNINTMSSQLAITEERGIKQDKTIMGILEILRLMKDELETPVARANASLSAQPEILVRFRDSLKSMTEMMKKLVDQTADITPSMEILLARYFQNMKGQFDLTRGGQQDLKEAFTRSINSLRDQLAMRNPNYVANTPTNCSASGTQGDISRLESYLQNVLQLQEQAKLSLAELKEKQNDMLDSAFSTEHQRTDQRRGTNSKNVSIFVLLDVIGELEEKMETYFEGTNQQNSEIAALVQNNFNDLKGTIESLRNSNMENEGGVVCNSYTKSLESLKEILATPTIGQTGQVFQPSIQMLRVLQTILKELQNKAVQEAALEDKVEGILNQQQKMTVQLEDREFCSSAKSASPTSGPKGETKTTVSVVQDQHNRPVYVGHAEYSDDHKPADIRGFQHSTDETIGNTNFQNYPSRKVVQKLAELKSDLMDQFQNSRTQVDAVQSLLNSRFDNLQELLKEYSVTKEGNIPSNQFDSSNGYLVEEISDLLDQKFSTLTGKTKSCRLPFMPIDDGCFFLYTFRPMAFDESEVFCKERGSHLPIIRTNVQLAHLTRYLRENLIPQDLHVWAGATDTVKEGQWLWVDNSVMSKGWPYWASGAPTEDTAKNCATFNTALRHLIVDSNCEDKNLVLCHYEV